MNNLEQHPGLGGQATKHLFHIPVLGTGFTVDSPLKVAKYGISSVISLVDDIMIEKMRKHYCEEYGYPYEEIKNSDEDPRARRITAYLNLLGELIAKQVAAIREETFGAGGDIDRYFELLPDCEARTLYFEMLETTDEQAKAEMQGKLREQIVPGSIDVNIMTKLDKENYKGEEKLAPEFADAMAALRGFAESNLSSSMVFSAGLNPRLYSYASTFKDFFPDENGNLKKKIILKVSDFRSASIQGKFMAKRGLWVSEYRIESGLMCGGHAFATQGEMIGPILEDFKTKKADLVESLKPICQKGLKKSGYEFDIAAFDSRVTVQGAISTADENQFLLENYNLDGTGWGTPFLLVPEATNVDDEHLDKLINAAETDVFLSDASPLGVPFWNLRTSASEETRRQKIEEGKPGSACPKSYLMYNTEFTDRPICVAGRYYQKRKLPLLETEGYTEEQLPVVKEMLLSKSCICHDLAGGATRKYDIDPKATTSVCCGPNVIYFAKIATLDEMVNHIYGRADLMNDRPRPHMFLREIRIYVDYLRKELDKFAIGLAENNSDYYNGFKENLLNAVDYYYDVSEKFTENIKASFLKGLKAIQNEIQEIAIKPAPAV